ncbi:Uncharacterized protein dnm_025580 [Desulfonema magnum]|uniref:Uncharacterized protein n=1 Tax=Desulfonema magnum TaxID=45655 RepID=A0A975GMC4_9BACT|nr:Uncharacterized protein dnm_025580 [Desulfonema magnum]
MKNNSAIFEQIKKIQVIYTLQPLADRNEFDGLFGCKTIFQIVFRTADVKQFFKLFFGQFEKLSYMIPDFSHPS